MRTLLTRLGIFVGCLVFPALLMGVLPVLAALWVTVGSFLLWPLASLVTNDDIRIFYAFWAGYYAATCIGFWLTVRCAIRRLGAGLRHPA